ncbi:MAG TPA: methyltransferase domain-containing protein [Bryobacteraceae bacterium]|nr:methyltransferase domain-containing protein [Bryobacteraceae bacterium]
MRRRFGAFLGLAALLLAGPAFGWQATHPLSGRRIAHVMGTAGADWLNRPERESEEQPEKALDALDLQSGMVVADIGAGTGYMTLKMARRVGPLGKVYAEDVQPAMLDRLRVNARKAGLGNIETVAGSEANPHLPANSLDLILMVDVYHEFSQPQAMLEAMRTSLKPDGRMVLLEYRKEDPSIPILPDHKMSVADAKLEVEAEGFRLDQVVETLPRQHILIFKKKP